MAHPFSNQDSGGLIRTPMRPFQQPGQQVAPVEQPPDFSLPDSATLRTMDDESLRAILRRKGLPDEQRRPVSAILAERHAARGFQAGEPAPVGSNTQVAPNTPSRQAKDPYAIETPTEGTFKGELRAVLDRWLHASVADLVMHEIINSGHIPTALLQ
jgi:hypothetical protein